MMIIHQPSRGYLWLALAIVSAAILILTSCTPASDLCAEVQRGGMVQDSPSTVTIIVDREVVAVHVPFADVLQCGGGQ